MLYKCSWERVETRGNLFTFKSRGGDTLIRSSFSSTWTTLTKFRWKMNWSWGMRRHDSHNLSSYRHQWLWRERFCFLCFLSYIVQESDGCQSSSCPLWSRWILLDSWSCSQMKERNQVMQKISYQLYPTESHKMKEAALKLDRSCLSLPTWCFTFRSKLVSCFLASFSSK